MKNKNGTTHTMPLLYREKVNFMDRMLIHILNHLINFQRTKLDSADLREISGHSLYRLVPSSEPLSYRLQLLSLSL
jgi:hypothetical protein